MFKFKSFSKVVDSIIFKDISSLLLYGKYKEVAAKIKNNDRLSNDVKVSIIKFAIALKSKEALNAIVENKQISEIITKLTETNVEPKNQDGAHYEVGKTNCNELADSNLIIEKHSVELSGDNN